MEILSFLQTTAWFAKKDARGIIAFQNTTRSLSWKGENVSNSLSQLFDAVDTLALENFQYYYKKGRQHSLLSRYLRISAWFFGFLGLMCPLLINTGIDVFSEFTKFGYVFLAISGTNLSANALFGGTSGHIRYVSAQLEIEDVIAKFRIRWAHYLCTGEFMSEFAKPVSKTATVETTANPPTVTPSHVLTEAEILHNGFAILHAYANKFNEITIQETKQWTADVGKALADFQSQTKTSPSK